MERTQVHSKKKKILQKVYMYIFLYLPNLHFFFTQVFLIYIINIFVMLFGGHLCAFMFCSQACPAFHRSL
jgi:hypothetical protein